MKHIVLGTAGHIDHGKTLLTKALTGVDTDRLAEEKARGITIELGFAALKLSDGSKISIVDVPGHERFVKTMMAGAAGIDGVLLVVAADDGVMPQTREHLDIIRLLRVQTGLVVITKCDLTDAARLAVVEGQIRELTRGSCLEGQPICPVSAVTGQGIGELKAAIEALVSGISQRSASRPARLTADRVFPVAGFGNIVTGTLTEGCFTVGQEVEIYPSRQRCQIRSLQNHNKNQDSAPAGTRTAMSFSHLNADVLRRGCVIAQPDSVIVTDILTASLQITPDCPWQIKNSSRLHLFHGTEETVCRLRSLTADKLSAGQQGYAQLQLAEPVAVRPGDRFLLRFFSPVLTIGGGTILACRDGRLKRNAAAVMDRLQALDSPDPSVRLGQRIADAGLQGVEASELRLVCGQSEEEFVSVLSACSSAVQLLPGRLYDSKVLDSCLDRGLAMLAAYHESYSLQSGMPQAQWMGELALTGLSGDALLHRWTEEGRLKAEGGYLALPGFEPVFTQEHKIMQRKLMHYYRDAWYLAPDQKETDARFESRGPIYRQLLNHLRINERLIYLSPRYAVHFEAYESALELFRELCVKDGQVTIGSFRTAAGISRKYSQLFLEYWDRKGISRRVGDAHVSAEK